MSETTQTIWLQYGAFGVLAFLVVSMVALFSWFVKHITPKAIEAFNENVKLQKVMSDTLSTLAERLVAHDSNAGMLAAGIQREIRDLHEDLVDKMEEHSRKLDRLLEKP